MIVDNNIDEMDIIINDSNNDSNNLIVNNGTDDIVNFSDRPFIGDNNRNNNDNYEVGSDPQQYFLDNHSKNICYYQDTIYEKEEEFTQSPGEYHLFGKIKGFSRDSLINKKNPNNAKFYFACEIFDDSYEKILSVKHRDIICSDKIILMICVQGEEKFRKVSLICLDKDWFDMNSQTISETSEFEDNTSSLLTAAIENSDSLISIIPVEMRFFYPNDNEDKFQETPSNYYSELKDCYELIYKKEIKDSLFRNEANVTTAAKLLRASVDLDCVLLHVGIDLPPVPPIPVAETVSLPIATTNRKPPQFTDEIGSLSSTKTTSEDKLASNLAVKSKRNNVGTAKTPRLLTEIMPDNIIATSSRICTTKMKETAYFGESLYEDTNNLQKATPKTVVRKKRNSKVTSKKSTQPVSAPKAQAKTTTAKTPRKRNQVNLPIVSSPVINVLDEPRQLPSLNNANTTYLASVINKRDKDSDDPHQSIDKTIKAVDSIIPAVISQDAQKIIDGLLAEKQDLASRLYAAETQVKTTSNTISDLQLRVEYLATIMSDKESGGHKSAGATIKAVESIYNQMFNPVEKQNGYDFSKSFDENKVFRSDCSSGRQFFEPTVPLGQSNNYNDYANYYNNNPNASNMMNPAVHPNNISGGMCIASNTTTPFTHQGANNGHMFNNIAMNNHPSMNQTPFSSVVGSGQQQQLPPTSHITPNMQLYYPSPHTSTSYNQHQHQMCLPPITQSPAFNNHYHYHNNNTDALRQNQSKDFGSLCLSFLNRM